MTQRTRSTFAQLVARMAESNGEDAALMLLRVLPVDVAENVLSQLSLESSMRLRRRLRLAPSEPPPIAELDDALAQFFDLLRLIRRRAAMSPDEIAAEQPPPANPIDELKLIPPDQLARAMEGEQAGAVSLILSALDPATVGQIIRRLPAEQRADIALRIAKPGTRNLSLLQPLAKAVVEKTRKLRDVPSAPSQEELIQNLADMLRSFPRNDRMPVVQKLEQADPEIASRVVEKLYRMEDLLRIPDRQIQMLLGKLDVKTVAVALKGAVPAIRQKVTSNMSSRSKSVLEEESELLGSIADSVVREAQGTVLAAVRKGEEDGQITMD
ncbi:Flagellar motor switch protein FliG [Gemmata obscuriglobus]|nr:Flagellar motor switch protein FliG [Gemmata obscuriglobus]VTS08711.1 flagellar motor switch protein : Flagellar motor switch protein FliG OS=Thermovirga lienii (strain ATCC BAA-1197 / DSM 17291 / Cas60314) GN=Tlie_0075 PE=4 SV=1: FliG_M: FliG_C [Gemmata obscuriglobus UQM 2246]